MRFTKSLSVLLSGVGIALTSPVLAADVQVMAPNCLASHLSFPAKALASRGSVSLLSVDRNHLEKLALDKQKVHCGGFVDVSRQLRQHKIHGGTVQSFMTKRLATPQMKTQQVGYNIEHEAEVNALLSDVQPNVIWDTLTSLTSFNDRAGNSDNGVKAAHWLKDNFDKMAKDAGRSDVNSYFVDTGWWYKQPSVVTVVGADIDAPALVVGAHMDTLNYNKPGADDDGSGSATITEAARVVLNAKAKLKRPVYFIWYAAEEVGLVGSSYVVDDFLDKKIPVKAVAHFDMTGYRYHGKDTMWLLDDNVNTELTTFLDGLIKHYIGVGVGHTTCGYKCSDHASWNDGGFIAAAPFEAKFGEEDPYIHSSEDKMEHVSLEHMTNYTKLALAFVGEMAN